MRLQSHTLTQIPILLRTQNKTVQQKAKFKPITLLVYYNILLYCYYGNMFQNIAYIHRTSQTEIYKCL